MIPKIIHQLTKNFGIAHFRLIPQFKNLSTAIYLACFAIGCNTKTQLADDNNTKRYKQKFAKAFKHYSQPKDSLKSRTLNNLDDQYHYNSPIFEKYKSILLDGKERSVSEIIYLSPRFSNTAKALKMIVVK